MQISADSVTAVIPVYNGASRLRRSIDSVLAQTAPPAEVIVVDDGSKDDSAAIAESYGGIVRCVRQPNGGVASARNHGLREAHTDWVALLDHDDQWLPPKLERQVAALRAKPESRICYTAFWVYWPNGSHHKSFVPPEDIWPGIRTRNPFPPSVVMLHRTSALELGGFDERLKGASCEDWDFFVRFLADHPVTAVDEPMANYFVESTSGSRDYRLMLKNTLSIMDRSLLSGLTGMQRALWRRRIKSAIYHQVAVSARDWGEPSLEFSMESLKQWPLPGGAKRRVKTLLVGVRDAVLKKPGK